MKKNVSFWAVAMLLFCSSAVKAQSLSDIVSSISSSDVVTAVTGGSSVTVSSVTGEWKYVNPAVELTSDSVLSSAAGTVVSSQLESKLSDACSKVGIEEDVFAFVFSSDQTFTSNIKTKDLSGTYTVDTDKSQITLKYSAIGSTSIGSLTADVTLSGTSMSLLFSADKLLSLLSAVSSVSSNTTLSTISALADQYDGIKLGFELEGESTTTTSTTSSAVSAAASALSKLF
ncbi:MAG: DUF4923 family protein [Rikenellaceae bacterium]